MKRPLRLLLLEDTDEDAELLLRELRRGGFDVDVRRVDNPAAFERALEEGGFELIVADYSLPQFNALGALAMVNARKIDTPLIIVSGTVGEDRLVEVMKAGAHDFLLKDHLSRLCPAVERELREAKVRAERSKMEEQILLTERLAAVGTLAASVAHEINNPLACIVTNAELAVAQLESFVGKDPELAAVDEGLRDIREAAERIRVIARDLRVMSRSRQDDRGPVDLHRVLDSSLRMARNELRYRAVLVKNYAPVLPSVFGSESRIGQVFLNLIVNAAQAIGEGDVDKNSIRVATRLEADHRSVVEISDSGSGMSAETMASLFTPFFTTKPVGIGTGLGLAICKRILDEIGATIVVESELGRGSTFRITFPESVERGSDLPAQAVGAAPAHRRGRVLVVDDETFIGTAVTRALAGEHEVQVAASCAEALGLILSGAAFDVILSDVLMPEMSGLELLAELTQRAPQHAERLVFLTGGVFTDKTRETLELVRNARIEKPFGVRELRAFMNDRIR